VRYRRGDYTVCTEKLRKKTAVHFYGRVGQYYQYYNNIFDMSLDILFDFAYRKMAQVFFLVLKAPLKYGNLMFYFVLLFITH